MQTNASGQTQAAASSAVSATAVLVGTGGNDSTAVASGVKAGGNDSTADVQMNDSRAASSGLKRDSVGRDIETPEAKRGVVESTQEKRQADAEVTQSSSTPKKSKPSEASSSTGSVALNAFDHLLVNSSLEEINTLLAELGAHGVDVSEVFNPWIFTNAAPRFGPPPGHAYDLILRNRHGEPWDFDWEYHQKVCEKR